MKKAVICLLLSLALIKSHAAFALGGPNTPMIAMTYDQCAKQGMLKSSGLTAEQKLRNYFEPKIAAVNMPGNRQQVANGFNSTLQNAKTTVAGQKLDQAQCDDANTQWQKVTKEMGIP
jgi:hypothetical protein